MSMKGIITSVFLVLATLGLHAQYDHEAVFSDKSGDELRELLVDNFKPVITFSYGEARDTLYGIIYNVNDSVSGIYTDHMVYLPPGEDPTTAVFMDGQANGINAEHSYPQSKGAGNGPPRSDMHHLFPSRVAANSARGSMPFGEVNDNVTDLWFYKTIQTSVDPSITIRDKYSEAGSGRWEPREQVKGNIARAIMYFYTMYKEQADNADPNFFDLQVEALCEWHYLDPVDQLEWERTFMIAQRQSDKPNPFVLDCSLASRIYCPEISDACKLVDAEEIEFVNEFSIVGNPFDYEVVIEGASAQNKIHNISVYTMYGKEVLRDSYDVAGSRISIPSNDLIPGTYVIKITFENGGKFYNQVLRGIKFN